MYCFSSGASSLGMRMSLFLRAVDGDIFGVSVMKPENVSNFTLYMLYIHLYIVDVYVYAHIHS